MLKSVYQFQLSFKLLYFSSTGPSQESLALETLIISFFGIARKTQLALMFYEAAIPVYLIEPKVAGKIILRENPPFQWNQCLNYQCSGEVSLSMAGPRLKIIIENGNYNITDEMVNINQMITMRKKVQILIYPKIFNVLSFYSKGQYTVHISVVQQSVDGQLHYAMPKIILNNQHKIHDSKKAYLKIEKQKNQISFVTEQFFITYNQQSVTLHSMALFSFQFDPVYHSRTYIDFVLVLNKYKMEQNNGTITMQRDITKSAELKNSLSSPTSPAKKRVTVQVDKRRVYINNLMELDQFKRVIFSQCQYFSFLDTYVGSCFLGSRFRLNKYQLSQFFCCSDKQKIQYRLACDTKRSKLTNTDRALLISKGTDLTIQEFRLKFNSQLSCSYSNLRRKMNNLIKQYQQQNIFFQGRSQAKEMIKAQIHIQTSIKSRQELQKYYGTQVDEQLYLEIYKQMVELDSYISYLWNGYIKLLQNISYKLFTIQIQKSAAKQNIHKQKSMVIKTKIQTQVRRAQKQNFIKRRKQVINHMKLYDDDDAHHPFIMVENYENSDNKTEIIQGMELTSLVVFVHGYQGSDYDLEKAKNYLSIYCSNSYGLLIKSIQDEIDQNIEHLGLRVAEQIKSHINNSINSYRKISLLGYSLGGVIIRQAVKHLVEYKDKMNLLITFASPHLGVSMPDNKLVGTGIWYLINFQKVKNLKQLNCEKTESQSQDISLKKLSESYCLSWFKKLVVVSSEQDNFVPHYSSRISDSIKDQALQAMAKNILTRINKIERVEVWFDVEHDIKTFDKILGRRAHIQFLQNRIFIDMFFRLYGKQF